MNKTIQNCKFLRIEYVLPFVFLVILTFVFALCDQTLADIQIIADVLVCGLFILAGSVGYLLYKSEFLNYRILIFLVLICGFALRLGYALKTGYMQNQHDVESLNSSGHLSYIYNIFKNSSLPNSNEWQFSHPPLHHFLAAFVVGLGNFFGFTIERCFENIQLITVFYSSISMIIGVRICSELGVKDKALLFCTANFAFFPGMFILAGSINNDILMVMLTLMALLYLIKWYKFPTLKFALLCGLFSGLAMMTKVSAAIFVVAAAVTVIFKFFTDKNLKFSKVAIHISCFLVLLLPLGFWHPIRNYILFEQPLGYVAPLSVTNPLYNGDISIFERLILPFSTEKVGIYVDVWTEYNLWQYIIRNSLFGEYNFGFLGIALFTVIANIVLIVLSVVSIVVLLIKRETLKNILPIFSFYFLLLAFFLYFNIKYPFGCSMDFRYIVPLYFIGVIYIGVVLQNLKQSNSIFARLFKYFAVISASVLCLGSIIIFI